MIRQGLRVRLHALAIAGLAACGGCDEPRAERDPLGSLRVEPPRPAPTRHDAAEPFDLGAALGCRVERLDLHLAERPGPPGAPRAVPADALVVRLILSCQSGQSVLEDARMVWLAPNTNSGLVPSDRTSVPAAAEGRLQRIFEVPPDQRLDPNGPFGELRVRSPSGDVDLVLAAPLPAHADATPAGARPKVDGVCAQRTNGLREALAARFAEAPQQGPECNVTGWLAPLRCRDVDDRLLDAALAQRRACNSPRVRRLSRSAASPPPEDFRIALRRDRCPGSLDRCPRYTLALYANGVTVFHGEHLVNALGRSDGRTHPRLLAGLWKEVKALGLLSRRGAHTARSEACAARGSDRGALLTVQGGGRSRTLVDRDGCRAPFEAHELALAADLIDAVAGVQAWTDPPPAYADRHVRVWEISP